VYPITYAVLPHAIEVAAGLEPASLADFWIDVGLIISSLDAGHCRSVPKDLIPGLHRAISAAEPLALQSFREANPKPPPRCPAPAPGRKPDVRIPDAAKGG